MELFSDSTGRFNLFDYKSSHEQLLFRRYKNEHEPQNCDIYFKGVYSLNIAIAYKGIIISVIERQKNNTTANPANRKYIFEISDLEREVVSYIDAAAFGVFKNNLHHSESCLGDFLWSKNNEQIFWYPNKDREDSPLIDMLK